MKCTVTNSLFFHYRYRIGKRTGRRTIRPRKLKANLWNIYNTDKCHCRFSCLCVFIAGMYVRWNIGATMEISFNFCFLFYHEEPNSKRCQNEKNLFIIYCSRSTRCISSHKFRHSFSFFQMGQMTDGEISFFIMNGTSFRLGFCFINLFTIYIEASSISHES